MLPRNGLERGDRSPEAFKAAMENSPLLTSQGFQWNPQDSFQGTTFMYTQENLWGNLGYGPNGANFDIAGIDSENVYVPGFFGKSKLALQRPPIMNGDFFKRTYLRGLEKFTAKYGDLNEQFDYWFDVAVGALEAKLGLFLYPRIIITDAVERGFRPGIDFDLEVREQDFSASDFFNWGWGTLQYGPLMSITQMQLVYPTGQEILKIPNSWIKPQMLSRQIRLVPPQGALSQVVIGPGGFLTMLIGGMMTDMPALIFTDYVAGMWPIPQQLIHAIAMQTAVYFLEIFSDMESQGMREYSVDAAGVRLMKRFSDPDSRSGASMAFGPRIRRYDQQINQILFDFQQAFFASTDIFGI